MRLTIQEISHHRNGICGDPFYAVRFHDDDEERNMLAIVFDSFDNQEDGPYDLPSWPEIQHGCPVAVVDIDLAQSTIRFGENSWRGDQYSTALYQAIRNWETTDRQLKYREVEV